MKRYIKPIYAGAYINDSGHLCINTNKDKMARDIVLYNQDTSGIDVINGVPVAYGYQYNPNCTNRAYVQFREELKHPKSVTHLDEFVETGILRMDAQIPLSDFSVILRVKPTRYPSVLDTMMLYLGEHSSGKFVTMELVKDTYDNVKFDYDKAIDRLREADYDEDAIAVIINRISQIFKENAGKISVFEMKRFLPRCIREYFTEFLKFSTEKEAETYRLLQGVDVLLYDDLLTSGSTIKEANRYLRTLNPSNSLSCYVLLKQH